MIKNYNPRDPDRFFYLYKLGKEKINTSQRIFRVMSYDEARLWESVFPYGREIASPYLIERIFLENKDPRKWFTFDRPYRFSKQLCNQRNKGMNYQDTRYNQNFMMIIELKDLIKKKIINDLLPDYSLNNIPDHMKTMSSRCKEEGGTITLGLSKHTLVKIARHLSVVNIGGRLTPFLNHDESVEYYLKKGRPSRINPQQYEQLD